MKSRCYNPKDKDFHRWGGRGIRVCDAWRSSFEAYLAYLRSLGFTGAKGQEVDRIDNDGHYEPGNLRITNAVSQARNRRSNRWISAFGQTRLQVEWSDITGLSQTIIYARLKRQWLPEDALTTPPDQRHYRKNHPLRASTP